ncbi:MAG: hypothetical protein AAGC60_00140 [Acidobacteriota bacterium]
MHRTILTLCLAALVAIPLVGCDSDSSNNPLPSILTATIQQTDTVLTTGDCAIDLQLLASGGTPPYEYIWESPALRGTPSEPQVRITIPAGTAFSGEVRGSVFDKAGGVARVTISLSETCEDGSAS